jgi:aldose sugar dehydrogenase
MSTEYRKRRPRRRTALLAVPLAMAMVMGTTACQPPSNLAVSTVIGGLSQPWDMAFAPDGTMLFTEKPGNINALISGSKVVMGVPTDVTVASEGGMMGIAVDPNFTTNRRIYTCYLALNSGVYDVRIVRWVVNATYTALSGKTPIVTGLPVNPGAQRGRHSGCRTRFGPDGNLWIATGDAAVGTNPQNRQSLGGKILRVDTDGNGVPGNPGVDDPSSGFLPQIYNYGHRNVQGLAFHPLTGDAYSIEHGTDCDDEVNRLVAGGNYGWDPVPGYNEATPMTDFAKFPAAIGAVWSSGCPTIAPSGGTFLTGPQWAGWQNNLAVAVLKDMHLHVFVLNGGFNSVFREFEVITNQGRLRSAVEGPDGNLYLAQDASPGAILKVVPTP